MKTFEYTIKDELGIHARPAGLLVKEAKQFKSQIMISRKGEEKSVDVTRLMALMGLAIKCGQTVEVAVEGEDEAAAFDAMQEFFKANL